MPDFRLTVKALADLKAIGRYTQKKWGDDQRGKYLLKLDAGFRRIARTPEIGLNCDYIRPGYRKYHVGRHLVFYRLDSTKISIIRILHERMDVPRHLSE